MVQPTDIIQTHPPPLSLSWQSTCSVSGRSWVRIPQEAACDTDVSHADGYIVNIVEGAILTMPLFLCATKAIAHLFFISCFIGSPEVWTIQSEFLMCYFSARAIIATGSSWACAVDVSLPHRFDWHIGTNRNNMIQTFPLPL